MVGNCHLLLASAKDAAGRTRTNMTPRASRECEKENRARAKCVAAANRGWMSEKIPPPAGQEKCFYLTSPFIEPARRRDGLTGFKKRESEKVDRRRSNSNVGREDEDSYHGWNLHSRLYRTSALWISPYSSVEVKANQKRNNTHDWHEPKVEGLELVQIAIPHGRNHETFSPYKGEHSTYPSDWS
jgi:hypothetical protein